VAEWLKEEKVRIHSYQEIFELDGLLLRVEEIFTHDHLHAICDEVKLLLHKERTEGKSDFFFCPFSDLF